MSQVTDYTIDNSTGANVRSDINAVLGAIATNNSGTSPVGIQALGFFANTTDNVLQLRNAANDAFINLRKFDGSCPLPDGTNSAPSLFFDDDTNTGIFSSAADTFNIATGGTERMELGTTTIFNEDGEDVDFRIESDDDANMFFVDAGNNRIGIANSSPQGELHIGASTSADHEAMIILNNGGATGQEAGIEWRYESGTTPRAKIHLDSSSQDLTFSTANLPAITIDSSQRVGIGTSVIDHNLSVVAANSATPRIGIRNPDNDENFNISSFHDSNGIYVGIGANAKHDANGNITVDTSTHKSSLIELDARNHGSINFLTGSTGGNPSERMRIHADGEVEIKNAAAGQTVLSCEALYDGGSNTSVDIATFARQGGAVKSAIKYDDPSTSISIGTTTSHNFHLMTNDTTRMTVDTSGRVGIGTTTIAEKLTIGDGDLKFFNSDAANNHRTTFIEFTSSSNRITSESNYGSTGSSAYAAGYKFTTKNFNGSAFETVDAFNIQANGNIGISTVSPSQKLHVIGNILASGTITPNSDIAFKKDIQPLTNVLNKVTQLLGINFTYKNNNEKSMGLVAQDVEKVFPELVRGEEGNKSLNYMGLTGALIEAIKELSAKVEALEAA